MRVHGGFVKKIRKHLKEFAARPQSRESDRERSVVGDGLTFFVQ